MKCTNRITTLIVLCAGLLIFGGCGASNTSAINKIEQEQYNRRPIQRVRNRIIGQPTGFTPSFMELPFGSSLGRGFGPGYNQSFGTNTGYGFLNSIPAMAGAGIKILD